MSLFSKLLRLFDDAAPEPVTGLQSSMTPDLTGAAQAAFQQSLYKKKLAIEIAVTVGGMGIAMLFSYWALEKLMKKMDPTSEEKERSEIAVGVINQTTRLPMNLTDFSPNLKHGMTAVY